MRDGQLHVYLISESVHYDVHRIVHNTQVYTGRCSVYRGFFFCLRELHWFPVPSRLTCKVASSCAKLMPTESVGIPVVSSRIIHATAIVGKRQSVVERCHVIATIFCGFVAHLKLACDCHSLRSKLLQTSTQLFRAAVD